MTASLRRLVLANIDYEPVDGVGGHTSDEGMQLQRGLESAGWTLAGAGFGDGCRHVPTLLDRHRPDVVFVQDARDWDPACDCSFRKDIGFTGLEALRRRRDIYKVVLVKDAGTYSGFYRRHALVIGANAAVCYYEPRVVKRLCGWLSELPLLRTYHSVDRLAVESAGWPLARSRGLVSGACPGDIYPLRATAVAARERLGIDVIGHPGYANTGAATSGYLVRLARYKSHVATASKFGFALRKIIESACVGCVPVTNLQSTDVLPVIDEALFRVRSESTVEELREAIDRVESSWDERQAWLRSVAERAAAFYDYKAMGARLSAAIDAEALSDRRCTVADSAPRRSRASVGGPRVAKVGRRA